MKTSQPVLEYGQSESRSRKVRRAAVVLVVVLLAYVAIHVSWKVALPWWRERQNHREIARRMTAIESVVGRTVGTSRPPDAPSLNAINAELTPLTIALRTALGRAAPFVMNVVHASQLADAAGVKYNVLLCTGGEQYSTLVWPVGSTDPSTMRSDFVISFDHNIHPPTRVTSPTTQPAAKLDELPFDVLVDGTMYHASVVIDPSGGCVIRHATGWIEKDRPPGRMVWTEVGRYGYRNVDVNVAPVKTFPHANHVALLRFLPDGRLAAASNDHIQIISAADGSVTAVPGPFEHKPFFTKYRMSPDGTRFFVPRNGMMTAGDVVDLLSGTITPLPTFPKNFKASDVCFESSDVLLCVDHFHIARVHLNTGAIDAFDINRQSNGDMTFVPSNDLTRTWGGQRGFPQLAGNARALAIGHFAGLFVLHRSGDGWQPGPRLDDWTGGELSVSPDGKHVGALVGYKLRIIALPENRDVFETYANEAMSSVEPIAWSDDGRRFACAPAGQLVFGTIDDNEKLAARIVLRSQNYANPFHGAYVLSRDGKTLALVENNAKQLMIWNTDDILRAARATVGKDADGGEN